MAIRQLAVLGILAAFSPALACKSMGFKAGRPEAVCQVASLGTGSVHGTVSFSLEAQGMLVEAELDGLTPGKHGIHIHEHGDCGGDAAAAAGGHFNPMGLAHGAAASMGSHEGDLGNIMADGAGHARLSLHDPGLQLTGEHGILGRSVVVHAAEDDLASQPAGNSGARIACGLITAAPR